MTATEVTNKIYQKVADKIIEMLDNNIIPWHKPWHGGLDGAISHMTGKPYSLLNQILCDFRAGEFVTFNQAKKLGGNVKKGAKGYTIVFYQPINKETEKEDGTIEIRTYFVLKSYIVFHIDDCEGLKPKWVGDKKPVSPNPIEEAEAVVRDYVEREKITLTITSSNKAYYAPSSDTVVMPLLEQFDHAEQYYSTLFHELTHSTGAANRLDRGGDKPTYFGSDDYSREELVAEMGAAYALARLGIENKTTVENSAAYIKNWREVIKNDARCVVIAATQAEKAINYIFD